MIEEVILLSMTFILMIVLLVLTLLLKSKAKTSKGFRNSVHDINKIKRQITEEE